MRPLIIGQAPGPNTNPLEPLSGRCGERLAELCGLGPRAFLDRFERRNLIDRFPGSAGKGDRFPLPAARRAALITSRSFAGRDVVLLGDGVARAFELWQVVPRLHWLHDEMWGASRLAVAPHPSGVSRWWNDQANAEKARRFWSRLAAGIR